MIWRSFQFRFHAFIAFSRAIASPMVGYSSAYTSRDRRCFLQKIEPWPLRCCQTRAAMSLVTPMYSVPNGLFVMTYTHPPRISSPQRRLRPKSNHWHGCRDMDASLRWHDKSIEQAGDRAFVGDPADRFGEQRGDGEAAD